MRIASKIGIVLATVAMTIGMVGGPAEAKDSNWPVKASYKYIP